MALGRSITVVGAGFMGASIATLYAAYGYEVVLHDQNGQMLKSYGERAQPIAEVLAGKDRKPGDILRRVRPEASLEKAVAGSFLVHEIIHEDLEAKRALFRELDRLCGREVVLATNTSSFLLTELAGDLAGRNRVIGIHYVSPAHLVQAVEIITAGFTRSGLTDEAREFLKTIDHVGIVCREQPGFLVNRIQYAMLAEAQRIISNGMATVEDVDAAVRLALGPRWALFGPLMGEDLVVSKKTVVSVSDYLQKATGEAHFAAAPALRQLAEKGEIGAAAGKGWYNWGVPAEAAVAERDRLIARLLEFLKKEGSLSAFHAETRQIGAPAAKT